MRTFLNFKRICRIMYLLSSYFSLSSNYLLENILTKLAVTLAQNNNNNWRFMHRWIQYDT